MRSPSKLKSAGFGFREDAPDAQSVSLALEVREMPHVLDEGKSAGRGRRRASAGESAAAARDRTAAVDSRVTRRASNSRRFIVNPCYPIRELQRKGFGIK